MYIFLYQPTLFLEEGRNDSVGTTEHLYIVTCNLYTAAPSLNGRKKTGKRTNVEEEINIKIEIK